MLWIGILSVAVSLDAFGVGLACGMNGIKIPFRNKLVMAFFSVVYASISVMLGKAAVHILPSNVTDRLGNIILFGVGLWICLQAVTKKKRKQTDTAECKTIFEWMIRSLGITVRIIRNPASCDVDCSGIIELRETVMVSLAMSMDVLGVGLGCATMGKICWVLPFTVALMQFLFLSCGLSIGKRLAYCKLRCVELVPGVLLMLIAVLRQFG